ncbi:hypothetical protein WDW37_15380 [Bdellovibrionota bacterium FG-1]
MITSERQYKVAQEKLTLLREALSAPIKPGVPEILVKAARGQTQQLAEKVGNEISDYEKLKNGAVDEILVNNVAEIYTAPIRFRIAKGWTLEQFGKFLKKDWRQILRYEQEEYQNATTSTLKEILEHMHLAVQGRVEVRSKAAPHSPEKRLRTKPRAGSAVPKRCKNKSAAR